MAVRVIAGTALAVGGLHSLHESRQPGGVKPGLHPHAGTEVDPEGPDTADRLDDILRRQATGQEDRARTAPDDMRSTTSIGPSRWPSRFQVARIAAVSSVSW